MHNMDLLEAQFDLINDGVLMINASQTITKINKSAQILLNCVSESAVGKNITEIIRNENNHLFDCFKQVIVENKSHG